MPDTRTISELARAALALHDFRGGLQTVLESWLAAHARLSELQPAADLNRHPIMKAYCSAAFDLTQPFHRGGPFSAVQELAGGSVLRVAAPAQGVSVELAIVEVTVEPDWLDSAESKARLDGDPVLLQRHNRKDWPLVVVRAGAGLVLDSVRQVIYSAGRPNILKEDGQAIESAKRGEVRQLSAMLSALGIDRRAIEWAVGRA